ncbi:MAG: hypothetical protein ABIO39_00540 [Caulobacteraceae bacterium]
MGARSAALVVGPRAAKTHSREARVSGPVAPALFAFGQDTAWLIGRPIHGFKLSRHFQGVLHHAYEATGPPLTDITQPA